MYHDPYSDAIRTLTLLKKLANAPGIYEDERLKELWAAPLQWERQSGYPWTHVQHLKVLPHSPTPEYVQLLPNLNASYYKRLRGYLNRHGHDSIGEFLERFSGLKFNITTDQGSHVATVQASNFFAPFLLSDRIIDSILPDLDKEADRPLIDALNAIRINRKQMIRLTLDHLKGKYLANLKSAPINANAIQAITYRIYYAESQLSPQELNDVLEVASAVIRRNPQTSRKFASMVEYLLIERILDLDAQGKDIEPLVKLLAHGYSSLSENERHALKVLAGDQLEQIAQTQPVDVNRIDLNDPYYISTLAIGIPLTLLGIGLLATRFSGVGALLLLPGLFALFAAAFGKENVKHLFSLVSSGQQPSPLNQASQKLPFADLDISANATSRRNILDVKPQEFLGYVSQNRYRGDWLGVGEAFMDLVTFVLYRIEQNDLDSYIQSLQEILPGSGATVNAANRIRPVIDKLIFGFESIWDSLADTTKIQLLDGATVKEIETFGGIQLDQDTAYKEAFNYKWLYSPRFRAKFGRLLGSLIEDFRKNMPAFAGYSSTAVGMADFMSDMPLLGSAIRRALPKLAQYRQAYQAIETLKSVFQIDVWSNNPTLAQLFFAMDWNNFNKLQSVLAPLSQP